MSRRRGPRLRDRAAWPVLGVATATSSLLYVCGITPYDATHLGHAATYLLFDELQRVLPRRRQDRALRAERHRRRRPAARARGRRPGEDWTALAERETELFREDMTALRVLAPAEYIGAVEAIPDIVEAIVALRDQGAAYDLDGDIYFSCRQRHRTSARSAISGIAEMVRLSGERGGDPLRAGQEGPARLPALAGARGRASRRGTRARPRSARLAHRVRGHRAEAPRPDDRRPGRRRRPGLPAPRAERRRGRGDHRRTAVRRGLRAPGDGRLRRREDVEVQGQPGPGLQARASPASTRWRSGSRCWPTTTHDGRGSGKTTRSTTQIDRLGQVAGRRSTRNCPVSRATDRRDETRAAQRPRHPGSAEAVDAWVERGRRRRSHQHGTHRGRRTTRNHLAGRAEPGMRSSDVSSESEGRRDSRGADALARHVLTEAQSAESCRRR